MQIDRSLNKIVRIWGTYTNNLGQAANPDTYARITIYPANSNIPTVPATDMINFRAGVYYYPFDTTSLPLGQYAIGFTFADASSGTLVTQEYFENMDLIEGPISNSEVTGTVTSYNKLSALSVANLISMKVNNCPASADGNHPTIAEIYADMTAEQRRLALKEKWTWLKNQITINNYNILTSTGVYGTQISGLDGGLLKFTNPGTTTYWAQSFTSDSTYLSKISSSPVYFLLGFGGFGGVSGTAVLLICPDLSGQPDLDNAIATSEELTPNAGSAGGNLNTFVFTNPGLMLKNTKYWFVIKFVAATDNGMAFGPCSTADGVLGNTLVRYNDATDWTAPEPLGGNTGNMTVVFNFTKAEYLTELTLPSNVVEVYAIHSGDDTVKESNMLPYADDRFIRSGEDLPYETFVLRRITGGAQVVYFKSGIQPLTWIVEAELEPTTISQDTDNLLVPDSCVDYIVSQCAGNFIGNGLGVSTRTAEDYFKEAVLMLDDMRAKWIAKPSGVRVQRSGFTRVANGMTAAARRKFYGRN